MQHVVVWAEEVGLLLFEKWGLENAPPDLREKGFGLLRIGLLDSSFFGGRENELLTFEDLYRCDFWEGNTPPLSKKLLFFETGSLSLLVHAHLLPQPPDEAIRLVLRELNPLGVALTLLIGREMLLRTGGAGARGGCILER